MAYLKVQLDEVFGRDHCIGQVAVRMSHSAGMKRQAKDRRLIKNTEYLLFYFNTDQPSLSALYEPCTEYPVNYYQYVAELPSDDGPGVYVPLAQTLEDRIPGIFDAHGLRPTNASIRRLFLVDARVGEFAIAERDRIVRKHAEVPRCDLDLSALRDDQFVEYRTNRRSYWMGSTDRGSLYQLIPLTDKVRTVDTLDEDGRLERTEVIANLLGDWWDGYWRDMSRVDHEGGVLMKESKKPERLIASVLALLTGPGDLVLDPFLGSGTTAAVAHKMGRRWIGIELGEHCESLALERLRRVVDGTDPTGITRSSGWRGGGGFRFFRLISQATEAGDDERRGRASIPTRPASR